MFRFVLSGGAVVICTALNMEDKKDPDIIDIDPNGEPVGNHQPLVSMPESRHLPAVTQAGLQRYLHEISQYPLLSREETDEPGASLSGNR